MRFYYGSQIKIHIALAILVQNASIGAYHGWNVVSKEGIECISAALHFLGERYGRSDHAYGHIASWTVGNEVNADTSWNYTGHQSAPDYAYIYTNMMRITSQAVKAAVHMREFYVVRHVLAWCVWRNTL